MQKRFLSVLLSIMLLSQSVLSGCGSGEAHSDNVVPDEEVLNISKEDIFDPEKTVTISGWLEEVYTRNLLAYLAEKYPEYKFEYKYIGKRSYESIINTELASREAYDIVMVNPGMARNLGGNGYIADMSAYCDVFNDDAKRAFSLEGRMYAVPNTSEYQCIFYNRDIVEKFGRTLPFQFRDFLKYSDDACEQMEVRALSCGIKDADKLSDNALAFLEANYFNTDEGRDFGKRLSEGNASFGKELQPYLFQWKELVNHKIFTREMCIMDTEAAIDEFASGQTIMYMGFVEDYNRIIEKRPNMRLGTTGVPGAVKGTAILIGGCNSAFAVNAYGMKKDVVVEMVADLASEDGQRALWRDRIGSQTYLKNVKFDNPPVFDGLSPTISAHRVYMPVSEWGEYGSQMYEILGRELQKVVSGERNVDIAVQVMDYEVEQILKKK